MTQWQNSYVIEPCMVGRGRDRTPADWVHCHGDVYLTSRIRRLLCRQVCETGRYQRCRRHHFSLTPWTG
ncbi:hypothetical protein E2C01_059510 [Portunus trituberculatus]|uniref:Uncharacterized protein n=1 Tax=Portunus trituberculatus TaxID=210409 RepID=A0A5B7H6W7_PORTR|nr:hypothetical protein [Portunus trituberculatus]